MRVVVQRVSEASVTIGGDICSSIGRGLLVLLGIEHGDTAEDAAWLAKKVTALRIFNDGNGVMNLDVGQTGGDILIVSQFTLQASTRKGNRPSYIMAAGEDIAVPLYEKFIALITDATGKQPGCGVFGANMKVALVNDGPVTIIIDSHLRE